MGNCHSSKICPSKVREHGVCYPNGCDCCPKKCNCCCPNGCRACQPDCCSKGGCKRYRCCLKPCCGMHRRRRGGRKKVVTWRQEYATEKIQAEKEAVAAAKAKVLEEFRAERKKKQLAWWNERHEPKVGRNGMTWAEKAAVQLRGSVDSKHLAKFERLCYKKPRRRDLERETWCGYMKVNSGRILQPVLGWEKSFLVLQGHFLYVFARDKPNARCKRIVLMKKADIKVKGIYEGAYFVILVYPKTPRRPYINRSNPSRSITNGTLHLSAASKIVQEGVAKEFKRAAKQKHGGHSREKLAKMADGPLSLQSVSLGGHKRDKHVQKWRRLTEEPPTINDLGIVERSGWLDRQGTILHPWVKKFIVMKGHWLYEFEDQMPRSICKRVVFIGGCKITSNRFANNGFTIQSQFPRDPETIGSEDKEYGLQCNELKLRQEWESAIMHNAKLRCAGRSKRKGKALPDVDEFPFQTDIFHFGIS